MAGTRFEDSFSQEVWEVTYKDHNDNDINDTMRRIAKSLASVEETKELQEAWEERFYDLLSDFKGVPGGRIMSNAGTDWSGTTLMNCFVGPRENYDIDSLEGIYSHLLSQSQTLKSEGGWGENFSYIRPRGSFINGIGVETPGSVKYMELFDKASEIITSGSGKKSTNKKAKGKIRKGAMMGVLDVWHPDIIEFITSKQQPGRLTKFNISVNCTDAFMSRITEISKLEKELSIVTDEEEKEKLITKIEELDKWELIFPETTFGKYHSEWSGDIKSWLSKGYPVKVFNTVSAKWLWNLIMESTYNRAEPGVLFLDRANHFNPLNYAETIFATNPCITGDTLIATADGRNAVSIKQLAEEGLDVPVYSTDTSTGQVQIKMGRNPRKTGINSKVFKVTLDDGSSFKATENHKIMLRNLSYVELKDLKAGDSLFPFYSFNSNGYRQISMTGQKMIGGNHRNRRQYRLISEFYNGPVDPKEYAIHHVNFDSLDDRLENLQIMLQEEHKKLHSILMQGKNNPYYRMSAEWKYKFASHPGEENGRYSGHTNEDLLLAGKILFSKYGKITSRMWKEYAKEHGYPGFFNNDFRFGSWENFKNQVSDNHKVVSVEFCGIEDVYNITVDDNHNYHIITSTEDPKYITSSGVCIKNCGEQTLSPGNICCLGTINLTQFVNKDSTDFDYNKIKKYVKYMVRLLDNVNSYSSAPLPQYVESMHKKRRIGLGIMGWGSSLFMMRVRFASDRASEIRENLMRMVAKTAYETSIDLAIEKGKFEYCVPELHAEAPFIKQLGLSDEYMQKLRTTGIRNSSLMSQQPNGNSSILANVVSGGIEPVFMPEYIRTVIIARTPEDMIDVTPKWYEGEWAETELFKFAKEGDEEILKGIWKGTTYKIDKNRGLTKEVLCEDYGVRYLKNKGLWDPSANWAVTTTNLTVTDHVSDLEGFAKWTDSACSKTCNIPFDYPYEDFKDLYLHVYNTGFIKGFTTYRSGTMTSVLSAKDEKLADPEDEEIILSNVKLPESAPASMKTLKAEGRKWYLSVVWNEQQTRPFALFVHTNHHEKNVTTSDAVEKLTELAMSKGIPQEFIDEVHSKISGSDNASKIARMISLNLRHGVLIKNIVSTLDSMEDVYVGSFLFQIKKFLSSFIKDGEKVHGEVCQDCGSTNVIYEEGCKKCVNCGSGKCS